LSIFRLLDWNVQWCRGIDGKVDPARIAAEIRRLADPDVICLQELAVNLPELEGNDAGDQVHALAHLFTGYTTCFVSGVDVPSANGRRGFFGNVVFSRLPVGRVLRHSLPWPSAPDVRSMPRVAVEAIVEAPFGGVRVMCTHLEYYSGTQRAAQIQRLLEIQGEAAAKMYENAEPGVFKSYPRPRSAILCGDFNMRPEDPLLKQLSGEFIDAWQALNPGKPHPHTFHVHEKTDAPYCCDYVFVTKDLVPRLRSIRIDGLTQASDHQPVILELG
jgi:endonuclease/exonuclease/phosphatase family metal-dependent hydrolase